MKKKFTSTPINDFAKFVNSSSNRNKNAIITLSVILLALIVIFFLKKDWLVVAQVNNSFVSNFALQQRLNEDFRKQAIDSLVNETIILSEAKNKNAMPTKQEVGQKVIELETRFGGADSLNTLLEQQGTTREGLKRQLQAQIALEKMFGADIAVTKEEIDEYLKTNKAVLQSTNADEQRLEAEKAIRENKLYQTYSQKFEDLRKNAKVTIF